LGRTVALQRTLTEPEWEQLVVDLRETFDARGRIRSEGNFRQWTNGNLQALLEPTPAGHQLRLRTVKGDAYALMSGGFATIGFGGFLFMLQQLVRHGNPGAVVAIDLMGVGMVAAGALRIPRWARERRQQMEEIAARLTESTAG